MRTARELSTYDVRGRIRTDLLWRAVPAVAAVVATLLGAPAPVGGLLALFALALSGEQLVRLRDGNALDRLLVLVGGYLVALVLTGIVLGVTTIGLRSETWSVALGVVAVLGLGVAAFRPPPARAEVQPETRRSALRSLPWLTGSTAVVVLAVALSVHSLGSVDQVPVQMSFGAVSGTDVDVVVSTGTASGPYEIRASGRDDVSYPLFSVKRDGSVTTTLSLPRKGRYVITLNRPDQTQPLRTLILDR